MIDPVQKPQIVLYPFEAKRGCVSYSVNRFIGWEKGGAFAVVESFGLVFTPKGKLKCVPRNKIPNSTVMVPVEKARFAYSGDDVLRAVLGMPQEVSE